MACRTLPTPLVALSLAGCGLSGAPSFPVAGAYFPGWMLCALVGIVAALAARALLVVSGLALLLPFQLLVCTSIGCIAAFVAWLAWFGQ
ncbi:MAG: hypothetical protein FD144_5670 [Rhodospirillaceae bacterium]|nr:MAG: hypothetical protein FD144_5670 [Rhodospirillaceae bacterium]